MTDNRTSPLLTDKALETTLERMGHGEGDQTSKTALRLYAEGLLAAQDREALTVVVARILHRQEWQDEEHGGLDGYGEQTMEDAAEILDALLGPAPDSPSGG